MNHMERILGEAPDNIEDCANIVRNKFSFDRVNVVDDTIVVYEYWTGDCKNDDDCQDAAVGHGNMIVEEIPELDVVKTYCHRHKYAVVVLKIRDERI